MSTPADDALRGVNDRDPRAPVVQRTRVSGTRACAIVATLLVFLLVLVHRDAESVTAEFPSVSGALPLGVSMLLSAVTGALVVAASGAARIAQRRRPVRRSFAGRSGHR